MEKVCMVCKTQPKKYKCPKCKGPYCSLQCSNLHKESCCMLKQNCQTSQMGLNCQSSLMPEDPQIVKSNFIEDEQMRIPSYKLKKLKQNEDLVKMLNNPHLRNMLIKIDNSKQRITELQKAMLNEQFLRMADLILNTVDPERAGNSDK